MERTTFRKKGSRCAAELLRIELPPDNSPVPFSLEADLSTGHELIIVPLMIGLDNTASTLTIRDQNIVFPPESGIVDVKSTYGAKGDGTKKMTA